MSRIISCGRRELMRATLVQVRAELLRAWAVELEKCTGAQRRRLLREIEREVKRIAQARMPGEYALF
jgi:hypothetical protein